MGTLSIGDTMQVTVEFHPLQAGDHFASLAVHYDTGEDTHTSLHGSAVNVHIRLDRNSVTVDKTYLSLSNHSTVMIHNRSSVIARFQWKAFATQEREDRQKERGYAIGPTFYFDVPALHPATKGDIFFGFPYTLSCCLTTTSLRPMTFNLRIPEDGLGEPSTNSFDQISSNTHPPWRKGAQGLMKPREFTIKPCRGTIRFRQFQNIQIPKPNADPKIWAEGNIAPLGQTGGYQCHMPKNLGIGEEFHLCIEFNLAHEKDLNIQVAEKALKIQFMEHPHEEQITIWGQVYFPNLHVPTKALDFGCIMSDTEQVHYVEMTNCSPIAVHYHWSFQTDSQVNTISTVLPFTPAGKSVSLSQAWARHPLVELIGALCDPLQNRIPRVRWAVASLPAQDVVHQRRPVETPSGIQQKWSRRAGMFPFREIPSRVKSLDCILAFNSVADGGESPRVAPSRVQTSVFSCFFRAMRVPASPRLIPAQNSRLRFSRSWSVPGAAPG
ncbi:hypothetical protein WISP_15660 [Willisornis vidua]|uniref:HYDIN/VesB/CFA65-like Ig-like domain-containing protein n=1 Tax=Willisornis vidua TaxID=1566151 RepID=A0ABQ9DVA6_9PASS|nr:hypothetical protein WISP_15660 [Willisornis vidua]